jgi:hypothetical protein
MQNFTSEFRVQQTPEQVCAAITNVPAWWSGDIDGVTDQVGAEFTYRHQNIHYSKQRISELIPGRRVVWQVLDAYLDFTEDPREWVGTEIVFEIVPAGAETAVRFSHIGLTPEVECFEKCSGAWGYYINTSLRQLIASQGKASEPAGGHTREPAR